MLEKLTVGAETGACVNCLVIGSRHCVTSLPRRIKETSTGALLTGAEAAGALGGRLKIVRILLVSSGGSPDVLGLAGS